MNTKRLANLLLLAALLMPASVKAQMIIDTWNMTTGVDTTLWYDISGVDTVIIASGYNVSACSGVRNIGFDFTLGVSTYSQFSTNINGTVRLGSTPVPSSGGYSNALNQSNGPKIEPFGWRGRFDDNCYTRMALLGTAGNRVRVVETRMKDYNSGGDSLYISFQVQLFEAGGLRIVYGHADQGAVNHSTQNGVASSGSSSNKDVIFINFATHEATRHDANCTTTNAANTWPEEGRWYMVAPDTNYCPYPPAINTAGNNPTNITLTGNGGESDLHILIPTMGIDTIWPATESQLTLSSAFNPTSTYNGTAQGICTGERTSYRARTFSFSTGCGDVLHLPWSADFQTADATGCWDATRYTTTAKRWSRQSNAMRCGISSEQPSDEWLVAPTFFLPDSDGITLQWDYKTTLKNSIAPTVEVRVAPCATDGTVDSTAWTTLRTINTHMSAYTTLYAKLEAYRGQRIKVAYVRTGTSGGYAYVDNFSVQLHPVPIVEMEAPAYTRMGDTTSFTARMLAGDDSNILWTWHSTLMDSTFSGSNEPHIVYTVSGYDTVSIVLSNSYGSDTATDVMWVADCNTVATFPWVEDFSTYNDAACWIVNGWQKTANGWWHDESNTNRRYYNLMNSNAEGSYMLSPAIALPASGMHNMKLWVECQPKMMVRLSATASTDTADYTDTLLVVNHNISQGELWWQVADLEPYAGQTVRIGFFKMAGTQSYINQVKIDHDTLPVLFAIDGQSSTMVDSVTKFTASLRRGATESLHYTWSSSHGGIISVNAMGDSMMVTYPSGSGNFIDTLTVVVANAFGSDTASKAVRVVDCTPAIILPWTETFADGIQCWYKPEGSKWIDAIPYNSSSYESQRHLYLNVQYDTLGSWIMSKAIQIPADTTLRPILSWKVSSGSSSYRHLYSILATTASDHTDPANYTVLYTDNATHSGFSIYDNMRLDLSQYVGQTIHIAINNHGNHMPNSTIGLYFDDIELRATTVPMIALGVPTHVNSHEPVGYSATIPEGSLSGLTLEWHSTLMDTTVTGTLAWDITYDTAGLDTITLIATNIYGTDTATKLVTVHECTPIAALPWSEDFNSTSGAALGNAGSIPWCWHRDNTTGTSPHVLNNGTSPFGSHTTRALVLQAGSDAGFDTVTYIKLPAFAESLNNIKISFWYAHEFQPRGQLSVGYFDASDEFVSVAMLPSVGPGGRRETVSLAHIPTEADRIVLRWTNTPYNYACLIDDITVDLLDSTPHVQLTGPASLIAYVGDTTYCSAMLTDGIINGLSYTWTHTLSSHTVVRQTPLGDTSAFVYSATGDDTVTVVATNSLQLSDTATTVIYVISHPLPAISTFSVPSQTTTNDIMAVTLSTNQCSQNHLVATLHSSLLDSIWSLPMQPQASGTLRYTYTIGGTDTLTVILSNDYGADTAVAIVNVTNCNIPEPLPFFEDFEAIAATAYNAAGALPTCWMMDWGGSTAVAPHVITTGGYSFINNISDHALFMAAGNTTGYDTLTEVTLPRFAINTENLSIAFDHRHESSTNGTLTVGYYGTDGTFIPVETLPNHSSNYLRDTVSLESVDVPDAQIVLRWANGGVYLAVVIDNIEVFRDSHIDIPTGLTVDSVSAHCASLSWQTVANASAYMVSLSGVGDTVVSDTTVTICGMEDDSTYSARVATIASNDTSVYSQPVAIHTNVFCAPLTDVTVSPDGLVSWQYGTIGEGTSTGVVIEITETASGAPVSVDTAYTSPYFPASTMPGRAYTFAIRTLCDSVTSHIAIETSITRAMPVPNTCAEVASTTTVTNNRFMDNRLHRKNYSQILYPADFAASTDTLYGISLRVAQIIQDYSNAVQCYYDIYIGQPLASTINAPVTADSLTMVAENKYIYMPQNYTGWKDIVFDIPYVIDGTRNLIVTIVEHSYPSCIPVYGVHTDSNCVHFVQSAAHQSNYTNPYTINFNWEVNTYIPDIRLLGGCASNICIAPNVTVTAQDTHNVSLSWQQLGAESQWLVEYRTMTDSIWTAFGTVATPSCTITGLHPSTTYELRVASLCADTLYGEPDTALTTCGLLEPPYTINFLFDGEVPCWTLSSGVSHYYWRGLTLYHFDNSPERHIVSPQVAVDIRNLRAVITTKDGGVSHLSDSYAVGICNSSNGNGAVWIDTIEVGSISQQNAIHFNLYNPPAGESAIGRYIILQSVAGWVDIEEFTLEAFTDCVPVRSITASQITEITAMLQWEGNDTSHSYAVYLDDSLIATQTYNTILLTSLTPNTEYTAAVREICGTGDTAAAVSITFRTTCTPVGLPYFNNIDYDTTIVNELVSECWTFHLSTDRAWIRSINVGNITALSLYDDEGDRPNYICSPRLMVGTLGAVVRFKGQTTFNSSIEAGVMIDVDDTSTFIPLTTVVANSGGMAWYEFSTDSVAACTAAGTYAIAFRWEGDDQASIDSLSITAVPVTTHTVTVTANVEGAPVPYGSGLYADSSTVEIGYHLADTAALGGHWEFLGWSDGPTETPRTILVTSDTAIVAQFQWVTDSTEGIAEVENGKLKVEIYPNPTHGDVTIAVTNALTNCRPGRRHTTHINEFTVSVVDLIGRTVIPPTEIRSSFIIQRSSLAPGSYFVRVTSDTGTAVRKLIVE